MRDDWVKGFPGGDWDHQEVREGSDGRSQMTRA